MQSILHFRKGPYAELSGGILSAGPHAGEPIYFVDYVDEEGGRLGVWDGLSYAAALEALAEWRQDGFPVVDLLREAL